ncbi:MAG: DivIVA domain-containing protein, partial [Actinomycetia bacterium]|nr:DivIVA domain-containing protein [Actinomycetes bacterium]
MELTPQLLETQQFPEKWRGYDQDAVDEFLERVGVAVAELQDRLRSATERVRDLESEPGAQFATPEPAFEPMSAPKSAPSEAQQVARALILAQEAADKAVAEANAEADALIAAANDKATRITAEAAAEAKRLTDEAERKHVLAVGKLDGAESHVAKLAEDALAEARTEASRLTVEAQAEADRALATARSDADRLVGDARVNAERGAAEAVAAKADELAALDRKIDEQRVQSDQLSVDLTEREGTLREVVVQLESLVGRFGSLSSSRLDAGTELSTGVGEPVRPTLTVVESESSSDGEDTAELELIDSADDDDAGISTETSARTDELAVDELAVDELAVEELAVEELAVEELAVEELAVEELAVEELAVDELAVEELAVEELAVEEPADDEVAD